MLGMTRQDEQNMRVLEYIYDHDAGSAGPAGLGGLRDLVGEDAAAESAVELKERGWIRNENRLSGGYHITAVGRSEVEALRQRREDRSYRRGRCRDDLLRWADAKTTTDPGTRVGREDFDGGADLLPYDEDEVRAAATFLAEAGFIKSISAAGAPHIAIWITDAGRECVDEGGVEAFQRARRTGGVAATVNHFNMGGEGNVFATATAAGAVAHATLNNFNIDQARLFAKAVRVAEAELDLPDEVRAALTVIEAEDAEPTRAQKATKVLTDFMLGASTGTVGQVLGMLGASALGIGT